MTVRRLFAISDIHGDIEALREAMSNAGLLVYKRGRGWVKKTDAYVVQVGDLANSVKESVKGDLACLERVGDWIDLMLVGNHEIPHFDPSNTFSGFHPEASVSEKLWEIYDRGLIAPTYRTQNGILISHAGVTRQQLSRTADHEILLGHWRNRNFGLRILQDCGRARYGSAEYGGILWCDFDKEFEPTEFPQIVGHTTGNLRHKGNSLCIDTKGRTGLPTVIAIDQTVPSMG
jgi:Calcineurin-like phosphoesterase